MAAGPSTLALPPPSKATYRKLQDLASGGMGSVELARAVSGPFSGQLVALKRLHPHLEREKHFADMFFDEAWITAGLDHPNIAKILDWGQDASGRYLALEFVPGDALLALLRECKRMGQPFPIDLALYIAAKTAEGLHAAHELRNERGELRHLVHRDVSPSNVLVSYDGLVKLIDFGVAKARDRLSHTSTGTIKGKFGYMSPEQARGFPVDRRSDLFSLGIVLWEMIAGRRLYRSESELEILRMIVEDPPPSLREARPDVPDSVDRLVTGVLAKNRDDRLGSCGEFADFLWDIYRERRFRAGKGEIAAFFQRVLPDRFDALKSLVAGADEFSISPTVVNPSSGSFPNAVVDAKSGAVPVPLPLATPRLEPPPQEISASHPSFAVPLVTSPSVAAVVAEPQRKVPIALLVGGGILAIGLIAGLGFALGSRGTSAPTSSASMPQALPGATTNATTMGTTANVVPGGQAAFPAVNPGVIPNAAVNPTGIALPNTQTGVAIPGGTRRPSSGTSHRGGANTSGSGQTAFPNAASVMLLPNPHNVATTGSGSQTTGSSSGSDNGTSNTGSSGSGSSGSGSSGSSGSSSGSSSTGTTGSGSSSSASSGGSTGTTGSGRTTGRNTGTSLTGGSGSSQTQRPGGLHLGGWE